MSRYGKTYPLGSREAMKREPSLDEEDYLPDPGVEDEVIPKELRLLGMPYEQKD